MIPVWSVPSSTSSSARIIPSETSPRTLPPLELEAARQRRAGERDGHGRAGAEVPGAADDLARLALADVDPAELEPVGVRVLPRLEHLARRGSSPRFPSSSGDAAALDRPRPRPSRSRAASRAPRAACRAATYSRSQRDRDAHQNCLRTRRSPSQSARMSGNVVRSCATRSIPHPNAKPRHSSGSRPTFSRTLRVDHARAAHLDPARSACTCGSPRRRRSRTRRRARSTAP